VLTSKACATWNEASCVVVAVDGGVDGAESGGAGAVQSRVAADGA
jgi:hypothetical protein